jgi:hypothetical protein
MKIPGYYRYFYNKDYWSYFVCPQLFTKIQFSGFVESGFTRHTRKFA